MVRFITDFSTFLSSQGRLLNTQCCPEAPFVFSFGGEKQGLRTIDIMESAPGKLYYSTGDPYELVRTNQLDNVSINWFARVYWIIQSCSQFFLLVCLSVTQSAVGRLISQSVIFQGVRRAWQLRELKMALYYIILQRFKYHICITNFSVGKCLSRITHWKVNNKNLQR